MHKYDIVLVDLNPVKGSEQRGKRPCVILQNNIANASRLKTITIAPVTSVIKQVSSAVIVEPSKKNGFTVQSRIELSQIRTIDRGRIIKKIGQLEKKYYKELREKIILFFDVYDQF